MKLFITMIALAFPLFASANTVVFQATSAAPETLKTLSFDSAYLTDDAGQLILTAGNLAGSFQTVSAVRMTEDAISFKAEKLLLNSWESGCGEAEFAKASI
ncbi:MAG TPA: hypothetical protein VN132_01430, partial [Bdellovibrio sp.]|nr:hypothetical protein [Bdellovibrio sp.]